MQKKCGNIYYNARKAAGLTQERWAEVLGVSVSAVAQYESGEITPADDVVLSMADYSGLQILGTWHLRHKSQVAAAVLPPVERLPLAQAVVQLLAAMRDFEREHHIDTLLQIAFDGRVDPEEEPIFSEVAGDLRAVVRAALQVEYSEKGGAE